MTDLTAEEGLIVRVAKATCFAFPFKVAEVPSADVDVYVDELLKLFAAKPNARLNATGEPPEDLRSALEFCAERLNSSCPNHAARLRAALGAV